MIIFISFTAILIIGGFYAPTLLRTQNAWTKEICSTTVKANIWAQDKTRFGQIPLFCSDIPITIKPKGETALAADISRMATNCWDTYGKGENDEIREKTAAKFALDYRGQPMCYPCYTFTIEKNNLFDRGASLPIEEINNYMANHDVRGNRISVEGTSASQYLGTNGFLLTAGTPQVQTGDIYVVRYFDTDTQIGTPWLQYTLMGATAVGAAAVFIFGLPIAGTIGIITLAGIGLSAGSAVVTQENNEQIIKNIIDNLDPELKEHISTKDGILITRKDIYDHPDFKACKKVESFDAGADAGRVT